MRKILRLNRCRNFFLLVVLTLCSVTSSAQDVLTLSDGSILEYYLAIPRNGVTEPMPLAVFMGGGSGDKPISYGAYRLVALQLMARGWATVVPVSPNNQSFRRGNVAKVRELIAELQKREDILEGKVLIGGISAGGMSALEIARQYPEDFLGIMAVPAIVRDNSEMDSLNGMPIYLRIGGDDELGWAMNFDDTLQKLEQVGAVVDGDILYGEPHMFGMDWDRLETWLDSVR